MTFLFLTESEKDSDIELFSRTSSRAEIVETLLF